MFFFFVEIELICWRLEWMTVKNYASKLHIDTGLVCVNGTAPS